MKKFIFLSFILVFGTAQPISIKQANILKYPESWLQSSIKDGNLDTFLDTVAYVKLGKVNKDIVINEKYLNEALKIFNQKRYKDLSTIDEIKWTLVFALPLLPFLTLMNFKKSFRTNTICLSNRISPEYAFLVFPALHVLTCFIPLIVFLVHRENTNKSLKNSKLIYKVLKSSLAENGISNA